jgi:hypothetical protein
MKTNFALLILFLLLFIFQCNQINKFKEYKSNSDQNIIALLDTVQKKLNKNNEVFFEIANFQTSMNDLKQLNKSLYDEVAKMKGDVKSIQKFDIYGHRTDTIYSKENTIYYYIDSNRIDGVYTKRAEIPFNFFEGNDTSFIELKGKTVIYNDSTTQSFLDYRKIKIDVVTGVYVDKGVSKIFVKTNSPFLEIQNISGAVLSKNKKQRFFVGPTLTYGLTSDGHLKPSVGISIGYNILPFKKKN